MCITQPVARCNRRHFGLPFCPRSCSPGLLDDRYVLTKCKLGSGASGAVYAATHREATGKFAVKRCDMSSEQINLLASEAQLASAMDHPHIVKVVDIYATSKRHDMVMECLEGGEVFHRLRRKGPFTESYAIHLMRQMLLAVTYLHSRDVVHRDIKLDNFLFESKDSDIIKLIDFGFASELHGEYGSELRGTMGYMAPEMLSKKYTSQCDMFSLGVCVFAMLSGSMPFNGRAEYIAQLTKSGRCDWSNERWKGISPLAISFVKQLLDVNPDTRLTAKQALCHPWILQHGACAVPCISDSVIHALASYADASQLRRFCMTALAPICDRKQHAEVRACFLEFDSAHAGVVRFESFQSIVCERLQLSPIRTREVFDAVACAGECITYSQFLSAMCHSHLEITEHHARTVFQHFDTGAKGLASFKDVPNAFERIGLASHASDEVGICADLTVEAGAKSFGYSHLAKYLCVPESATVVSQPTCFSALRLFCESVCSGADINTRFV